MTAESPIVGGHDSLREARDVRDLLRDTLDHLIEGVQVIGPDYRYLYVNDAAALQGRSSRQTLTGRSMTEVYPGIEETEMFAVLRRCMQEREPAQVENEFQFPGGSVGWFELRMEPVPSGVAILSVDITARKQAEARLRAVYENLPHAAFVWEGEGDAVRLVDLNDAAKCVIDDCSRKGSGDAFDHDQLGIPHLVEDVRACLAHREQVRREVQWRGRFVLTYGFVEPDMVLMLAEDVTEQRRMQEQLLAAQRLDAVGRLAGGVAHDFNNLLSVILSYADFALDDLAPDHPLRVDIQEIRKAGERAAALTRQLVAFNRNQVMDAVPISLNAVIEEVQGMLRRILREDIEIAVALDPEFATVLADPGLIQQVIVNLAVNARDAMPRGGRLVLGTRRVTLGAETDLDVEPGSYVVLSASDTGVGMDPQTRARVFEPFFTTKERGQAAGLGLATVYGIVKQSGGAITVTSELGQGTTFEIYLRVVEERVADAPSAASGTWMYSATILLVEDEKAVRLAAERILEQAGYEVLTAEGGAQALEVAEQHPGTIDLLVTDVIMPKMSGLELAAEIVRFQPEVCTLFMSGYLDDSLPHHELLTGRTCFLPKPFSPADLVAKVRAALDSTSTDT